MPELESAEDITAIWVKVDGLRENLEKLAKEHDCDLDQRMYLWALGLESAQEFIDE